jgi:RNA polymerase sigma-70 factor (ECF subfamily)
VIEVFTEHRSLLSGIAYRMLSRVAESEDMVQETWLRWQRQNPAEIRSPKAWLVAAVTRLCIDQLRLARHEREEYYGVWLPEPIVESLTATADESASLTDSLTMAFMLMLEVLSPVERAAFLLRNVFDYDYSEIAEIVNKSETNCRQIASRAKARLEQSAGPQTPPSRQAERIVQQFLAARSGGSVSDLLALLTEDATRYADGGGRVPSASRPIRTANHVSRFLIGIRDRLTKEAEVRLARVNGQVGALIIAEGRLTDVMSFDIEAGRVRAIYIVRNPKKLRHLAEGSLRL